MNSDCNLYPERYYVDWTSIFQRMYVRYNNRPQTVFAPVLIAAVTTHDEQRLQRLLQTGQDPNIRNIYGDTPLFVACRHNNGGNMNSIIKALLAAGADPNIKTNRNELECGKPGRMHLTAPLLESVEQKNHEIIKLLLQHKADPNIQTGDDNIGDPALYFAVSNRDITSIKMLLAAGANPTLCDTSGNRPGAYLPDSDEISHLLRIAEHLSSKHVNEQDDQWKTLLLKSVIDNYLHTVEFLIECKANPNIPDNDGWTPLMYAVRKHNNNLVDILINAGANLNLKNKNHYTALMIAEMGNDNVIAQRLRDCGAIDTNTSVKNNEPTRTNSLATEQDKASTCSVQ